ncbi:TPA: hypothetical protein U2R11_002273 [Providencia stuartii]|uniref:hypothetical protein n=1 Tax=Providencia stuartii TaxID=588 RepID=UPI000978D096|nr:hypothetical protein [Providencia stuartii]OMH52660.1 hypothetical protein BTZ17_00665 [Providencia stuartii]UQZ10334.1 hypothetical protein M8G38_10915 [Providencia stuartii]HEM8865043.1 hypothetical protein [Providencia stuartii]
MNRNKKNKYARGNEEERMFCRINYAELNKLNGRMKKDKDLKYVIDNVIKKKNVIFQTIYYIYVHRLVLDYIKSNLTDNNCLGKINKALDVMNINNDMFCYDICIVSIIKKLKKLMLLSEDKKETKNRRRNKRRKIKSLRDKLSKSFDERRTFLKRDIIFSKNQSNEYSYRYDWVEFISSECNIIEMIDFMMQGLDILKKSNEAVSNIYRITDESYVRTVYATLDNYSKFFSRITLNIPHLFIKNLISELVLYNELKVENLDKKIRFFSWLYYSDTIFNLNKIKKLVNCYYDFNYNSMLYNELFSECKQKKITNIIQSRNEIMHLNTSIFTGFKKGENKNSKLNIQLIIDLFSGIDANLSNDSYFFDRLWSAVNDFSNNHKLIEFIENDKSIFQKEHNCYDLYEN